MAAASLVLLGIVAAIAWVSIDGDPSEPYVAPLPSSAPPTAAPVAAEVTLHRLEEALRTRDEAAAEAVADPAVVTAAPELAELVEVARAARIDEIALRYIDEESGVDADGVWAAAVDVVWRFRGFDPAAARSEVEVFFRLQDDGSVRVTGVGGPGLRTPVWMSGDIAVRRTPETLVLAAGGGSAALRYQRLAVRAVPVVRRVVPDWRPRLVVEVPARLAGLDRALGVEPGEYAQIAAVTVSPDGTTTPRSPVHVFVNPDEFAHLHGAGAQVVMSHEATHVATHGPLSLAPTWLVEGLADYVALRDVALPLSTTAGQIARLVRRDGLPKALPTAADFGTDAPHLGAEYEAAWLLCRTLADGGGEQRLLALYRRLSEGKELAPELRRLFGWTPRELLTAWQARLSDLPA